MSLTQKMTANYYLAKFKMRDWVEKVKNEELGASDMVVVIILIVIVLGVAVTFRDAIGDVIGEYKDGGGGMLGKLFEFIDGTKVQGD